MLKLINIKERDGFGMFESENYNQFVYYYDTKEDKGLGAIKSLDDLNGKIYTVVDTLNNEYEELETIIISVGEDYEAFKNETTINNNQYIKYGYLESISKLQKVGDILQSIDGNGSFDSIEHSILNDETTLDHEIKGLSMTLTSWIDELKDIEGMEKKVRLFTELKNDVENLKNNNETI